MMSICVISLVVWLTLVFLSVTEGMERGWLKKLTSLNAPVRLTPTPKYYHSYYHLIDQLSYASGYQTKSLREKCLAANADPYDPDVDSQLPAFMPEPLKNADGSVVDLVQETFTAIGDCSSEVAASAFEMTGGLLKLRMIHPEFDLPGEEQQNYLTQVTYISSFPEKNPSLPELLLSPKASEVDHLIHMAAISGEGIVKDEAGLAKKSSRDSFQDQLERILDNLSIDEVVTHDDWEFPITLLPEGVPFHASYSSHGGRVKRITLAKEGTFLVHRRGKSLFLDGKKLHQKVVLYPEHPLHFSVKEISYENAKHIVDLKLRVKTVLQGKDLSGSIPYKNLSLEKVQAKQKFDAEPKVAPPWTYQVEGKSFLPEFTEATAVVIAKSYQESGVQVGDLGYLSYGAQTTSGVQEQRIPISVAGFYDPGIMSIGNKCIFTDSDLVTAMRSANHSYTLDRSLSTGIQVWTQDLSQAEELAENIRTRLDEKGLSAFWQVQSFRQYDFAKDLLQQFESDKYLFTLIGIIILVVACTNIISLLSLLVNDKREEIAILQAMGATKGHIATIFAGSGVILGLIGSVAGTALALLTLHNIDHVAQILSFFQGHDAFNSAFYGTSLPNELSKSALLFMLISTPIISLVAGLVPALKACRLQPAEVLK
ncbi:MAG: FtsX-like permease family protein [Candidatus Algichlamydia australiensis]|nr:FtsX-like permease family protein [Chlamydiales bacterium]